VSAVPPPAATRAAWSTRRRPITAAKRPETTGDVAPRSFLAGVDWSISFVALLLYIVIITTYRIGNGEIVMAAALGGLLLEKQVRTPPVVMLLFALVAWAYTGLLTSQWPNLVSQWALVLFKVTLIMVVAASTLVTRQRVRLCLLLFVLAFALYPARGAIFNYFLGGYTVAGRAVWNNIYANPNDLAALTLLQLSIVAGLYLTEPPGWTRRGALAAQIVLPVLILLTQSRAGFVGLAFFGMFLFAGYRKKARAIALACVVGLAAFWFVPDSAWDRLGMVRTIGAGGTESLSELDDMGSAEQRFAIWKTAVRIIADHPVTGVGWGAYPRANGRYSPDIGQRDAHSTYLNLAAEVGFPGLALFLAMVGLTLARSRRARLRLKQSHPNVAQQLRFMELGLIAYLLAAVFGSFGKLTFMYLQLILLWSLAEAHAPELRQQVTVRRRVARGAA
jgi:putative inorganic carbon (hco3(-)) transporter